MAFEERAAGIGRDPLVPVFRHKEVCGFPKYKSTFATHKARYVPLSVALSESFRTEAHFCGYSLPAIDRRINQEFLQTAGVDAVHPVPMVLAVFDVDDRVAHKLKVKSSDEWWFKERTKVLILLETHPGGFVYRTFGGYRIVYRLPEPIILKSSDDGQAWKVQYLQWIASMRRRFDIEADPSCQEWNRLFKAPHATRQGNSAPEQLEVIGDPACVAQWECEVNEADVELAKTLGPAAHEVKSKYVGGPSDYANAGDGVFFYALKNRGDVDREVEPGKWNIRCPWEDRHSGGKTFDNSTVLYAPTRPGQIWGHVKCSHSHCDGIMKREDVKLTFSQSEIDAAMRQAGVPVREYKRHVRHDEDGVVQDDQTSGVYDVAPPSDPPPPPPAGGPPSPPAPPPPDDDIDRPVIRLGDELAQTVDEMIAAIATDKSVFRKDWHLVHVIRADETLEDKKLKTPFTANTPLIEHIDPDMLSDRLARIAVFEKYNQRVRGWLPTHPPERQTKLVTKRRNYPGVRTLRSVLEAPSIRPDGTIIQTPGYDEETGCLYIPSSEFPVIPENPTQADAVAAYKALCEPFVDFPFAGPEHMATAIAAILTIIARPAIEGSVPAFINDANVAGSGKTLKSDLISAIATGRPCAKKSYPATDEEMDKCLCGYAQSGAAIIAFDNIDRPFGCAPLDMCITAGNDRVEFRILGKSDVISTHWRTVILVTGNNIVFAGDMSRRALFSRIESELEDPEEREGFLHPRVLKWSRDERPRLVAAALTILRAWHVAGRPRGGCKVWGSFEEWSEVIPTAIVFAGGADPMATRFAATGDVDPKKGANASIIEGLSRLTATVSAGAMSAKEILSALYTPHGEPLAGGYDGMRETVEAIAAAPGRPPDAVRLGRALTQMKRRFVGNRCVDTHPGGAGIKKWFVTSK